MTTAAVSGGIEFLGVPLEFLLFGAMLVGVALAHHRALEAAATGLAAIILLELATAGFHGTPGLRGLVLHLEREWVVLANLGGLLLGVALLSRHFADRRVPDRMPELLPDDWRGGLVLLALVFVLSSVLDNIAAALVGGTVAAHVYRNRVHIGYLAAIVAASNAGGSGSVVGDTTTTLIWIAGATPVELLRGYVAAGAAFLVFGIPAAMLQQRHAPIVRSATGGVRIDGVRLGVVAFMLVAVIVVNVTANLRFPQYAPRFPFAAAALWAAVLVTAFVRRPAWEAVWASLKGTAFLLCLVLAASLMPVQRLPDASAATTLGLGFVSAVFDNIPLTALALEQDGYDWGLLAYAVGFGGSMIWFGSSAGVAITNLYPEGRSVGGWLRYGWPVGVGYVVGFAVFMLLCGWQPRSLG
jgi:Na+/H+ antiporter NhaD/arsenite permease-like protein